MSLTKTTKLILIISTSLIFVTAAVATPTAIVMVSLNQPINFTLLENAGVMIEARGKRIYVDPYNLPDSYGDLPADAILITHDHGDHYDESVVNMLQKSDTLNVFPASLPSHISVHDGMGVVPGDKFRVGSIKIKCFYMYTIPPPGYTSGHPQENNYTSYIIDTGRFTFFHAGDSSNIPEYSQLTGSIDVAMLPLGPGCQTMTGMDVVLALEIIDPTYFIPIHFGTGMDVTFCDTYDSSIESRGIELLHLSYYSSHIFNA